MKSCFRLAQKICGALLLAALASNCGSMEMFFVNPGGFDYLSCADIAKKIDMTQTRERELKTLIDRAEQGMLGSVVAATAYRSDYLKAQGELKLLAETAQRKNCAIDPITGRIDARAPPR